MEQWRSRLPAQFNQPLIPPRWKLDSGYPGAGAAAAPTTTTDGIELGRGEFNHSAVSARRRACMRCHGFQVEQVIHLGLLNVICHDWRRQYFERRQASQSRSPARWPARKGCAAAAWEQAPWLTACAAGNRGGVNAGASTRIAAPGLHGCGAVGLRAARAGTGAGAPCVGQPARRRRMRFACSNSRSSALSSDIRLTRHTTSRV
jgi:hypothetical protein